MKKTKRNLLKTKLLVLLVLSFSFTSCMNDAFETESNSIAESDFESDNLSRSLTSTGYIQGH